MKRFIEGADRTQVSLLPGCVDDYVAEDNPVRVIEAFVDRLDLREMGFEGVDPEATGRPAYHPSVLLKIYIYGYLNRVQSSRRLEHETQRNLELMWLTGRLMPDFKTIANFRKDNGKAIRRVCRQFIVLCRQLNLFTQALVAIDGSKFKAVNNRDKNFTAAKMKRRMEQVNESIERYLRAMDSADRAEPEVAALKKGRLQDKIAALQQQMEQLKSIEAQMNASPDKQVSLTDPDARSMKNREGGIVGYNVQTAVDAEHHLIVAHEVINVGVDRDQLASMAGKAQEALGADELTVVADRGYFKSEGILKCTQSGITPLEAGLTIHKYWSSACTRCPIKARCTTADYRRITRWEHEAVLDAMQERLDRQPDSMRVRRRTVEHPFGTLKAWMGATHFLTRTLARVRTEMSLHVLAYNLKRVMQIFGIAGVLQLLSA